MRGPFPFCVVDARVFCRECLSGVFIVEGCGLFE
jgi:hypothetical protein